MDKYRLWTFKRINGEITDRVELTASPNMFAAGRRMIDYMIKNHANELYFAITRNKSKPLIWGDSKNYAVGIVSKAGVVNNMTGRDFLLLIRRKERVIESQLEYNEYLANCEQVRRERKGT